MTITRQDMMGYGRFGYRPGKFKHCRFCHGDGCPACDDEAKKAFPAFKEAEDAEYKRLFPDGPKPIAVARFDSPEDLAELKRVFGRESLESAFGEGGKGMDEILQKLSGSRIAREG